MSVRLDRSVGVVRGKNQEALEFATTISSYVSNLTGAPVVWGLEVGGTVGKFHFYSDYENLAALEAALGQIMADEGYQELLDSVNDVFDGAAEDTLVYIM